MRYTSVSFRNPDPQYLASVQLRLNKLKEHIQDVLNKNPGTFSWEIGSGHGHFLIKYAAANPSRFFIGIDLLSDRLRRAEKKQVNQGVKNLCFIKAEAGEFLESLPSEASVEEVLILFPDPWPKKRHHKNRLIQPPFLDALAARMHPAGRLYFRTDFEPYFAWTKEMIAGHPRWELDDGAPWVFEEPTVFQGKATAFSSLVARLRIPSEARRTTD